MLSKYWPLLLMAFVVVYLALAYPFDSNDWRKHYAFFNLLKESSWPPILEIDNQKLFLRHHLAWYIVPAIFTKIFGASSLLVVMIAWTTVGLFTSMLLAFQTLHQVRHLFLAALVFFLFSGLDFLAVTIFHPDYNIQLLPGWLQFHDSIGLINPNLSNIAWIPTHMIGGGLGTCLFLYNRRLAVQYSGLIISLVALWSPFCAIGILPIAIWSMFKVGWRHAFTRQNLLIAPLLAIPIALYMTQEASSLPFMFVWQHPQFSFFHLIIFITSEFLLILAAFWYLRKEERDLIIVLGSFLLLLCLTRYGAYNDLLARGSMPAICVMAVMMLKSLLENKGWRREMLVAYLFIGAFPVVLAFAKGVSMPWVHNEMTLQRFLIEKIQPPSYSNLDNYNSYYLAKTVNVRHIFTIPLLRGLPEVQP